MGDRLGRVTADDLRRAFDDQLARPPAVDADDSVDLLIVRVGDEPFAILVSEIDGIHRCPPITPVPSDSPSLLGIVALRGHLLGLHGVSRLIGGDRSTREASWIVVCRKDAIALGLQDWTGHARVPRRAIVADDAGRHGLAPFVTSVAEARVPVLSVPAIALSIMSHAGGANSDDKD